MLAYGLRNRRCAFRDRRTPVETKCRPGSAQCLRSEDWPGLNVKGRGFPTASRLVRSPVLSRTTTPSRSSLSASRKQSTKEERNDVRSPHLPDRKGRACEPFTRAVEGGTPERMQSSAGSNWPRSGHDQTRPDGTSGTARGARPGPESDRPSTRVDACRADTRR